MIARLLCKMLGHKWRRPHKAEAVPVGSRVCGRCDASRAVRARKVKA